MKLTVLHEDLERAQLTSKLISGRTREVCLVEAALERQFSELHASVGLRSARLYLIEQTGLYLLHRMLLPKPLSELIKAYDRAIENTHDWTEIAEMLPTTFELEEL